MASVIQAGTASNTALTLSSDTSGELQLKTNSGSTTAMTLTTGGNVGIGTTSPSSILHIASSSQPTFKILYTAQREYGLTVTGGATTDGLAIRDESGSAEIARFCRSGNVGIGLTNPSTPLDVYGAINVRSGYNVQWGTSANYIAANTSLMQFGVNSAERMRIDSSGNVGIGASSFPADTNLTVLGNFQTGFYRNVTSGGRGYFINIGAKTSGGFADGAYVFGAVDSGDATGYLTFGTRSGSATAERMRITSAGRLAIGSTTTNYPLYVKLSSDSGDWFAKFENTQSSTPYGFYLQYPNAAPNGTASDFIYCADSAAARMTVRSNGGIANYSANDVNLSDEREKTNIQLAGSYLDKICAIPVKKFNYIDQNREEDDGLTLGVIAQDVQKVAPELVMESNWAAKDEPEKMRLSIYQTDLQYALMKCIQEQQAMIEELKQEVAKLKGA